jgi:hypothetical protein
LQTVLCLTDVSVSGSLSLVENSRGDLNEVPIKPDFVHQASMTKVVSSCELALVVRFGAACIVLNGCDFPSFPSISGSAG